MAGIPPTSGAPSQPPPSEDQKVKTARNLSQTTKNFIEQTYDILRSPQQADQPQNLEHYAKIILELHQFALEARGGDHA